MTEVDSYVQVVSQVIKAQGFIMGPVALDEARKVVGIKITSADDVKILGDPANVITSLVKRYERMFGAASVEVCKDAVKEIKPPVTPEFLPEILR